MKGSLVLELQQLAQASDTTLTELLRRAKVLASKLNIDEARTWIDHETDGYPEGAKLPPYRVVPSELKARNLVRGWQPVRWDEANIFQKFFSCALMRDPIANIEAYSRGGSVQQASLHQDELDMLFVAGANHELARVELARFFSRANFIGILEAVRTKILDWSLALERRGVLGHGMSFDDTEKLKAAEVPFRIDGAGTVVLFVSANPDPTSPLDVEKAQSRITKVRNGSKHQGKLRIESLPDLDLAEFAKSLRLQNPAIVHFSGHGKPNGSLVMRDENGKRYDMQPKGLAKLLALQKNALRLVVLNACYSRVLADLLSVEIDCVVGMSDKVSDDAATLFAQAFYGALFDGQPVGRAFATSQAVVGARYEDESDVPVLKTRAGVDPDTVRLVE